MANNIISQWLLENSEFKSPEVLCETLKSRLTELNPRKVQNNVEIMLSQGVTTNWLKKCIPSVLNINEEEFLNIVNLAELENEKIAQKEKRRHRNLSEPFPYIHVKIKDRLHSYFGILPFIFSNQINEIIIRLDYKDIVYHRQKGTLQQHFYDLVKIYRKHFMPENLLKLEAIYEVHISVDESYVFSELELK